MFGWKMWDSLARGCVPECVLPTASGAIFASYRNDVARVGADGTTTLIAARGRLRIEGFYCRTRDIFEMKKSVVSAGS